MAVMVSGPPSRTPFESARPTISFPVSMRSPAFRIRNPIPAVAFIISADTTRSKAIPDVDAHRLARLSGAASAEAVQFEVVRAHPHVQLGAVERAARDGLDPAARLADEVVAMRPLRSGQLEAPSAVECANGPDDPKPAKQVHRPVH